MDYKSIIRSVADFPKEGIVFRDITTLLQKPEALVSAVNDMTESLKDVEFDYVLGPESRGFIFGVPVAYAMNKGFIPVRKQGKLPYKTKAKEYALEYGTATIEIHEDAFEPGQKVVIVDDLLATGGTTKAMIDLVKEMGGEVVKLVYLIELDFLNGRSVLGDCPIHSLINYDAE
ncbi:MAG: apt [Clostridiales bacterium]|jgi:adenine phosphoribosyltransferase|nr:apt [Clostridiales bacterium]